jgi:outer membrane protein assembly factor BamB
MSHGTLGGGRGRAESTESRGLRNALRVAHRVTFPFTRPLSWLGFVFVGILGSCFSDGDTPQSEAGVAEQSSALILAPFCYGASGVQPMAPSPMVGLCPTHRNQSPAVGAQSNIKPSGWTNGVAMGGAVRGSPVISSSGMIVSGSTARIVAVNSNGTIRWPLTPGLAAGSSPAIGSDGRIYMVTNEGSPKVRQLNAADGSSPWSAPINGTSSAGPALSADGATLYVTTQTGRIYALNTSNGATRWWKSTGAISTSPAIAADGTIYVGADDGLYAFLPDGTKAWGPTSFGTGAFVRASPAIAADGTIYVGTDLSTLEAVNPDGTKRWTYTTAGMGIVRSSPAIANDGTIYFGTRDDKLYAVHPNGTLSWTFPTGGNVDSSPAIGADGTVYVGSDDFKLYAVRPNGTELFSVATTNFVRGGVAIGRNGTVYVGSDDQKLWAFGPGTCGSTDTTCNGVDENCSGSLDEGYASQATSCGVGACASTGATSCVNGAVQDSCAPGTPAASDSSCNGVDENCDGTNDEGFVSSAMTCGVGACARTGTSSCVNGAQQTNCTPGTPASTDATCDARDDDCNGVVDDGCGSSSGPSVAPVVRLTPESIAADGSTWADANGSGIVFSGGGSSGPSLGTGVNGRHGLYFNGWQYMQGSLGDTTSWTGVTITAVFATFGVPPLATVFGTGGAEGSPNATAGVRWVMGAGLDPARGLGWAGADGTTHLGGGGYEPSTYYVVTWKRGRTGAGWTVRRNGQALTSAPIADSSFPTGVFNAFLGAEKAPDGSHYGGSLTLHELHVYPQELGDADTAALERGLAEAYDIGWYADGATAAPDVVLGSDLVAWYDAFALSGADGSPLASWPNRAANAALAASGSTQPLLATRGIHGHPGVVADGVDDFMLTTLDPPMPVGSRPHVWAVLRNVTPLASRTYVRVGVGGQPLVSIGSDGGAYPNWLAVTIGGSGVITPSMSSAADTVPHIVSAGMSANFLEHGLKVDGIRRPARSPIPARPLFQSRTSGCSRPKTRWRPMPTSVR